MQISPIGKPDLKDDLDGPSEEKDYQHDPYLKPEQETPACAITTHWLYSAEFLKSLAFAKTNKPQAVQ